MAKRELSIIIAAACVIAAAFGGYYLGARKAGEAPTQAADQGAQGGSSEAPSKERKILYWQDPMFPQQRFDKPGKSPFMDMQLVPVYADEAQAAGGVSINPRVVQNLGVRLTPVEAGMFRKQVDTVGMIRPDERRIEVVQSRVMGWVERLHVKAVNDPVQRGQLLAEVYGPDLLAAQEEYLLAHNSGRDAALAKAARDRLSLLGLSEAQIASIEKNGKASRRVAFYSPVSGIVAELGVRQGMAVNPGMTMFNLVDLSTVWVTAEIVENQALWVSQGSPAEARVAALPGKRFEGRVDYVYPELTKESRTLKARIALKNPGLQLKPGMLASVTLYGGEKRETLMVPSEAVIQTGKRTVVILAEGEGKFRPVEVVTGMEAEGKTEILKGLEKGQNVVASGQFLIDSEASVKSALKRLEEPEKQEVTR